MDQSESIDVNRLFRLDGRVALVTGGTRGNSERYRREGFGRAGARVVVASRKPAAPFAATQEELCAVGIDTVGIGCHMGSLDDVRDLVAAIGDRFGEIDIVVNNTANALAEPIGSFSEAGFTKSIDVNVKGPIFLVQEALPYLRASAACISHQHGLGGRLALLRDRRLLRRHEVGHGLLHQGSRRRTGSRRHSCQRHCLPGSVDTDMVRQTGPVATSNMAAACLLRRVAHAHEMVGPALFLASDASSYVTGTVV